MLIKDLFSSKAKWTKIYHATDEENRPTDLTNATRYDILAAVLICYRTKNEQRRVLLALAETISLLWGDEFCCLKEFNSKIDFADLKRLINFMEI